MHKIKLNKIFLIISFFFCWTSISTSFEDLLIFNDLWSISFSNYINFLRHALMYILFPILIFINIDTILKNKIILKENFIFFMFIFFFILQIPGLIITNNSIENISFIISSLNIILSINIIKYYSLKNNNIIYFFIIIFFLNIVLCMSFFPVFISFLKGESNLYGSQVFIVDKLGPRSSGISRTAVLILLLNEIFFKLYLNKFINIKIFYRIILITIILLFQSRVVIILVLFSLMVIFFSNKFNIKNLLSFILINLVLPILLSLALFSYHELKIQINAKKKQHQYNLERGILDNYNEDIPSLIENYKKDIFGYSKKSIRKVNNFTSGRTKDWKNLFINMKDYKFFGVGAQGDRFLINQTASNGILYAYSSSGIVGLLIFVTASFLIFLKSIKIVLLNFRKNYIETIYSSIILVIFARSVFETSYAVFSIDLIVLIFCVYMINYKKISNKL